MANQKFKSTTISKKPYSGLAKYNPIVKVSRRDELKCLWNGVKMMKIPLRGIFGMISKKSVAFKVYVELTIWSLEFKAGF